MKTIRCVLVALAVLVLPGIASASHYGGYRYSQSYQHGYRYYGGGYYGTSTYYPSGYYADYQVNVYNVVNVAAFVPYFVPSAVFTTYQATPAVALTAIAPVQAVAAPADPCAKHIAAFEARIAEMEKKLKAAPVDPPK